MASEKPTITDFNRPSPQPSAAAETRLAQSPANDVSAHSDTKLLHGFQVRQTELERQNEALIKAHIALKESLDRYVDLYELAPVGYLTITDQGVIADINQTCTALLRAERQQLLLKPFVRFVKPEDAGRYHLHLSGVLKTDEKQTCELELQLTDGLHSHVRLDSLRLTCDGGAPALRVVLTDITERKQLEEAQKRNEMRFRELLESMPSVAVQGYRRDRTTFYWNEASERLYGYTAAEAIGRDLNDLIIPAEMHEAVRVSIQEMFENGTPIPAAEVSLRRKDGSRVDVYSSHAYIHIPGLEPELLCVDIDLTERKRNEHKIIELAFYDPLTKLPNRRLLNDRLIQAMATSKRSGRYGALMFLDLDNFKPLNDKHGHAVGDLLLIEAAERLRKCVREADTVSRFGGDEFVMVLTELVEDSAESAVRAGLIAEKIRSALSVPYQLTIKHEDKPEMTIEHHCTASVGVTLFEGHTASQDDILKWADIAMYQAKKDGRNLIRFFDAVV
ncbi:MAG: diguanylate cyclase [Betaproteobacteria bacterium]